jgi:hypothetical protein
MLRVAGVVFAGMLAVLGARTSGQAPAGRGQSMTPKAATPTHASTWKTPRTPWGDPDLQGTWNNGTITPLERPREAGEKELLSKEEEDELNQQSDTRASAENRPKDPAADVELAYDQFWWDRGKSIGRTSLIIDPKDGRLPPLTAQGQKLQDDRAAARRTHGAFDSWIDRPLQERCIMYHGVPPLPSGYNNTYQIFQTPGLVAILDENIHHVRLIPLDGRPHIPQAIRHWNGDSRGRWEGDTLVVETTNFNDKTRLRYGGSSNTHAVERFRRVSDELIDYQFTITDPTVYTRPFTVSIPMPKRNDRIYEYACHEGNHSMVGILGGARAEEKRAEEAAAAKERR